MVAVQKIAPNPKHKERHADDFYSTPYHLAVAALRTSHYRPVNADFSILDVGCGTGVWGRAAREVWPQAHITGVDISEERLALSDATGAYDHLRTADFLEDEFMRYDLIIGNPPYNKAREFVQRAHGVCTTGGAVIFLLRLAFVSGDKRYKELYADGARPDVVVLSKRPSFTDDGGTDRYDYGFFTWYPGVARTTVQMSWWHEELDELPQNPPKAPDNLGQSQPDAPTGPTLDDVLADIEATCSAKRMASTLNSIDRLRSELSMTDRQIARMIADSMKKHGKSMFDWNLEVYLSGGNYYARWRFQKDSGRGSQQIGPVRNYMMDVIEGAGSPGAVA